ncbi:outer membrane protein assembly factor BamE [bacterium]|nr:outer membrane protein assembly factor BamE [bacterium]
MSALSAIVAATLLAGCATVGREFPPEKVPEIRIGETTRTEILAMFGEPWRTGLEDGDAKWTYGRYRYSLFGASRSTDLTVRFDDAGRVLSYSFNTTEAEASAK